jgi:aminopeptidase N
MDKWLIILISMLCSFIAEAQSHDATDFLTGAITIKIEPYEQRIEGYVEYRFQTIENTNIISLDAQNMLIEGVTINGRNVRFRYDNKQLSVHKS